MFPLLLVYNYMVCVALFSGYDTSSSKQNSFWNTYHYFDTPINEVYVTRCFGRMRHSLISRENIRYIYIYWHNHIMFWFASHWYIPCYYYSCIMKIKLPKYEITTIWLSYDIHHLIIIWFHLYYSAAWLNVFVIESVLY